MRVPPRKANALPNTPSRPSAQSASVPRPLAAPARVATCSAWSRPLLAAEVVEALVSTLSNKARRVASQPSPAPASSPTQAVDPAAKRAGPELSRPKCSANNAQAAIGAATNSTLPCCVENVSEARSRALESLRSRVDCGVCEDTLRPTISE
ncbi:MAG: hypothetical protein QM756_29935 [Polyangiaceae bacterium]